MSVTCPLILRKVTEKCEKRIVVTCPQKAILRDLRHTAESKKSRERQFKSFCPCQEPSPLNGETKPFDGLFPISESHCKTSSF